MWRISDWQGRRRGQGQRRGAGSAGAGSAAGVGDPIPTQVQPRINQHQTSADKIESEWFFHGGVTSGWVSEGFFQPTRDWTQDVVRRVGWIC